MRIVLSLIAGLLSAPVANAADVSGDKVLLKAGSWTVRRTPDLMSGKKACTALYQDKYLIQLTETGLFVSQAPNGGLKSYTISYDDGAAGAEHAATPYERDIQSAALKGEALTKALSAKRLRLHITTAGDRIADEDIDLTGIDAAHNAIVRDKNCQ